MLQLCVCCQVSTTNDSPPEKMECGVTLKGLNDILNTLIIPRAHQTSLQRLSSLARSHIFIETHTTNILPISVPLPLTDLQDISMKE